MRSETVEKLREVILAVATLEDLFTVLPQLGDGFEQLNAQLESFNGTADHTLRLLTDLRDAAALAAQAMKAAKVN
jgi:hypothetical protein